MYSLLNAEKLKGNHPLSRAAWQTETMSARAQVEKLCGIDPGLATGGMVLLGVEPERVLAALALGQARVPRGYRAPRVGDSQFNAALARAQAWVDKAAAQVREWEPDLVVIESFTDLGSHARRGFQQKRWQTPLVIGLLHARLLSDGLSREQLQYQNPAVLKQMASERARWQAALKTQTIFERDVLLPGDRLISSPHLVSACCHASWAVERVRSAQV